MIWLPAWWADGASRGHGSISPGKTIQALKAGLIICERFCFVHPKMFLTHESHSIPSQEYFGWGGGINLFVLSDVLGLFWSLIVCALQLSHDAIFKQQRLGNAELGWGHRGPGLLRCASGLFYDLLGDSSERSWPNSGGLQGRFAIVPNYLSVIGFQLFCNSLCICSFWDANID